MSLSVEIPENSEDHYDYKCKVCGRKVRFTPAFFLQGFTFPLQLQCVRCQDIFTVDLRVSEGSLPELSNKKNKPKIQTGVL